MSSLAKQLEKLTTPLSQVSLAPDKKRASLLYDAKEAASIDRDTIFNLGLTGLEELCNLDEAFGDYEASLFSQSSQNWERAIQTREVNERLDATISDFLIRLSPYLLLQSAHKALEWLICRYHIHVCNSDSLLLCALPYHDALIFVRLLKLLPWTDQTSKWHWLQPCAKAGSPLMRRTLVNHCISDPGFLSFLCGAVPQFIKVHGATSPQLHAVLFLYTCCALGATATTELVTERVIGVLLPHITVSLRSRCPGYQASGYMIVSQIAAQAQLQESLVSTIVPVLTKKMRPHLAKEALMCLLVIYQRQKVTSMSKKSMKQLVQLGGVVTLLAQLCRQTDIAPLLMPWLQELMPAAVTKGNGGGYYTSSDNSDAGGKEPPQYAAVLLAVLQEVPMDDAVSTSVAIRLLELLIERRLSLLESAVDDWGQFATDVVNTLQNRHSHALMVALQKVSKKNRKHKLATDVLQQLTTMAALPLQYRVSKSLPKGTSLMLALKHNDFRIRLIATQQLVTAVKEGSGFDDEFVKTSLMERLKDDKKEILETVLSLKEELTGAVDSADLVEALFSIVHNNAKEQEWTSLRSQALALLASQSLLSRHPQLAVRLLPQLVLFSPHEAELVRTLTGGAGVKNLPLFGTMLEGLGAQLVLASDADLGRWNWHVVDRLVEAFREVDAQAVSSAVSSLVSLSAASPRAFCLSVCLLARLAGRHDDPDSHMMSLDAAQTLLSLIQDHAVTTEDTDSEACDLTAAEPALMQAWLVAFRAGRVAPSLPAWGVMQLIDCVRLHKLPAVAWTSPTDPLSLLSVRLFDLVMRRACDGATCQLYRHILTRVTGDTLQGEYEELLYRILPVLWTAEIDPDTQNHVSPVTEVGSLLVAAKKWSGGGSSEVVAAALDTYPAVLLSLLLTLQCPHAVVRSAGLDALRQVKGVLADSHPHHALVRRLCKRREEILTDHTYTAQVVGVVFRPTSDDGDASTPAAAAGKTPDKSSRRSRSRRSALAAGGLSPLLAAVTAPDTPVHVANALLQLLQHVDHKLVLPSLLPLGKDLLSSPKLSPAHLSILQQIVSRFDAETAPVMKSSSPELTFCLSLLTSPLEGSALLKSPRLMGLAQWTKEAFHALPDAAAQKVVLSAILDMCVGNRHPEVATAVKKALKQIKFGGSHILHEISFAKDSQNATVKATKRARTKKADTPNLDRLLPLLEVLQGRKRVKDTGLLVPALFNLLAKLLSVDEDRSEYCRQLTLTCLHSLAPAWAPDDGTKQDDTSVEVLVQCVRQTSSVLTQQQALLVMATIAHLFPDYILHNVMSIFTFLGSSSLVQHDDAHSAHVVTTTVNTVIPALIKAHSFLGDSSPGGHDLDTTIAGILRVFVDARQHMLKHRSLRLLQQVVAVVGEDKFLWVLLAQLMESAVRTKDGGASSAEVVEDTTHEGLSSVDKELEFVLLLVEAFPAATQLRAATSLLAFLAQLTQLNTTTGTDTPLAPKKSSIIGGKQQPASPGGVGLVCGTAASAQHLRLLNFHTTRLVVGLLGAEPLIAQVVSSSESLLPEFGAFTEAALSLLSLVTRCHGNAGAVATSAKFWKALLGKVYEVLDKVNYVLPSSVFLSVVGSLMAHPNISLRRKALDLLIAKLQQFTAGGELTEQEESGLLALVGPLLGIAGRQHEEGVADAEWNNSRQLALFSLKLLCKLLAAAHTKTFVQLLPACIAVVTEPAVSVPVLSSGLLCIAEVVTCVKAHAIPHIPHFMPPLIDILSNRELLKSHELVCVCALTALQRILSWLPHFLSPYLLPVVTATCRIPPIICLDAAAAHTTVRWKAVCQQLSTAVSPRVLVPVLAKCHQVLLQEQPACCEWLLALTKDHVTSMTSDDLGVHHNAMVTFFTAAMDFRNTADGKVSPAVVSAVEASCLAAVLAMVVRLSEAAFRPMFYTLYDWACRDDASHDANVRKIVFFSLCHKLSERLKSIFNLFVGHTVKQMADILTRCNSNNTAARPLFSRGDDAALQHELLVHVLSCLHQCLLHDAGGGLVTTDVFSGLLQPLLDQLENTLGGEAVYQQRIELHVVPAVCQLAVVANDDNMLKTLNYQLCLKTRHKDAKVRFAALQVIAGIAERAGDDYMSLLPETIPFLAELMEDDVEEVEQQCQQVVAQLEGLLGESLQKYF